MGKRILVTGGAGFIGSHLADQLLQGGHSVVVLDSLEAQVHGEDGARPPYLDPDVELLRGDVRDSDAVRRALRGVDIVYHFAAAVGVGQSMYRIAHYVSVNGSGTATLLEEIARRPVERLVVASSMSIYGEGQYVTARGERVDAGVRSHEQLKRREWEFTDRDGERLRPFPVPETKTPALTSVYALSKYDQERLCLMLGEAYGVPAIALRFFNVYGPRQALSNPYTGVLAIFASRVLNGRAPVVFEDGCQRRDFVSVHDVARACVLATERDEAIGRAINVGSGVPRTVLEVAREVAVALGRPDLEPEVPGRCRVGDVRHCFADISVARGLLGYRPNVAFAEGLAELADWLRGRIAIDRVDQASAELAVRGLTV